MRPIITFPPGTGGYSSGYLGVEYNGDPVVLGSGGVAPFDTVYSDPLTNASAALVGPLETADYIFDVDGITLKADGLYSVDMQFVAAPVDGLVEVTFQGTGQGSIEVNIPIGVRIAEYGGLVAARAGTKLLTQWNTGGHDLAATYNYGAISVWKLAS